MIRVLHDYGAYEGMKFYEGEFETVDAAVKAALASGYGTPFVIVDVIDWSAEHNARLPAADGTEGNRS